MEIGTTREPSGFKDEEAEGSVGGFCRSVDSPGISETNVPAAAACRNVRRFLSCGRAGFFMAVESELGLKKCQERTKKEAAPRAVTEKVD